MKTAGPRQSRGRVSGGGPRRRTRSGSALTMSTIALARSPFACDRDRDSRRRRWRRPNRDGGRVAGPRRPGHRPLDGSSETACQRRGDPDAFVAHGARSCAPSRATHVPIAAAPAASVTTGPVIDTTRRLGRPGLPGRGRGRHRDAEPGRAAARDLPRVRRPGTDGRFGECTHPEGTHGQGSKAPTTNRTR